MPVSVVRRWNKATKAFIDVQRPHIVDVYNRNMGGVDLLDSLTAKYKFPVKARRWYIYIFWHTITLAVVNAWLLYKRDCAALNKPEKEIKILRRFQSELADSLILVRIEFIYILNFNISIFQYLRLLSCRILTCKLIYSVSIRWTLWSKRGDGHLPLRGLQTALLQR